MIAPTQDGRETLDLACQWIVSAMARAAKADDQVDKMANGFAADVQRDLAGERVLAVPPSAGYRLKKFTRKNRAA